MPRPTKIEEELSAEQLQEFFSLCFKEGNLTGARIQELAAERGIRIGHNSAAKFKKGPFADWLETIQRRSNAAEFFAKNSNAMDGATLSDAVAAGISQDLVEMQMAGDLVFSMDTEEGIAKGKALTLMVARLRTGDRAMQDELRTVKAELDLAKKAINAATKKGTALSVDALRALEENLGWKPQEAAA